MAATDGWFRDYLLPYWPFEQGQPNPSWSHASISQMAEGSAGGAGRIGEIAGLAGKDPAGLKVAWSAATLIKISLAALAILGIIPIAVLSKTEPHPFSPPQALYPIPLPTAIEAQIRTTLEKDPGRSILIQGLIASFLTGVEVLLGAWGRGLGAFFRFDS